MRQLRWFLFRLTSLVRVRTRRRDLDEELRFHLEAEADEQMADGVSAPVARQRAMRAFGNVARTREDAREVWGWSGLERLAQDLRYALRVLWRERSFATTALLTIALLVGGTATVFTLVQSVLLQPLPYPDADRLTFVQAAGEGRASLSYAEFEHLQRSTASFDAWALFRPGYVVTLDRTSENPIPVQDMRITPGLFPLLGFRIALGRPLQASDELDANPDVGVISHDLWQQRFGGASNVIGQSIAWRQGRTLTIVGVAAPGAVVPTDWLAAMPIVWNPIRVSQREGPSIRFAALARLKNGHRVQAATAELAALGSHEPGGRFYTATGLLDHVVGDSQRVLWIFLAAVSAVFLIGVANLVSLQLVRNTSRERELGLRAALGASRWRLVRQLLTESCLLAAAGGAGGFLAARAVMASVVRALPRDFPRIDQIAIGTPVWIFAIGLSAVVAVVVGVIPALRVVRPGLAQRVADGSLASTTSRRRASVQRLLIAFEVCAALVLFVGAGLLINSFARLISEDAGMQERDLWVISATLPPRYQAPRDAEFWTQALHMVGQVPGVERATIAVNDSGPLSGGDIRMGGLQPEGGAISADGFSLSARSVGSGYFETLGIRLIEGRSFGDSDLSSGEYTAVLNQRAASTLWPGQTALGQHLRFGSQRLTIVGIVPDFNLTRLDEAPSMQMYVPYTQRPGLAGTSAILVRARRNTPALGEQVKAVLANMERDLRGLDASTMSQVRWRLVATERFRTTVLLVFAGSATLLALVGVFGLVAYVVGQRTREIGLRVALGSSHGRVVRLILVQALLPAALGVAAGVVVALLGSRVLSTFLFNIEPTDPATFVTTVAVFLAASAGAALAAAFRAFSVRPADALRHE